MPSEKLSFTPSSILFHPQHMFPPVHGQKYLVEVPGIAPGSDGFIAKAVYRYSRIDPASDNIVHAG